MNTHNRSAARVQPGSFILAASVCFLLLVAVACSVVSKVAQTTKELSPIHFTSDGKQKKIGIMEFENRVSIPFKDFTPTADSRMVEVLADSCADLLLTLPGAPDYPTFLKHPPRRVDGQIDALALARRGRQYGFNAVVSGGLVDIDGYREERGFLWFKDNESFIKLLVKVEVYDTRTGTKFVDRLMGREINAEEMGPLAAGGDKDIGNPTLIAAAGELIAELAEEVCEALEDRPWVGYVTAVDAEGVAISSGSDQGIAIGDMLDVFDSTGTIAGAEGERFFQIGPKTGEVTVTAVTPDRAQGVATGYVTPGCSLTVK